MSVLNSSLLLGADAGSTQYQVSRSLRFNSSDSAFCSRSVTAGNQKTWSLSFWLKRAALGIDQEIFATANGDLVGFVRLTSGNLIRVFSRNASAVTQYDVSTVAVLRDCSAWYHVLVVQDTTQAASGDRIKIYINGTLQTLTTATAASLNADCAINSTNTHNIGNQPGASVYLSAYLADVVFTDGQALTPSSLTEVSATTGQLIPKAYTGSYGTNGFKLDFADNSAATAAALGKDTSPNGNNWTPTNLSVTEGVPYSSFYTDIPVNPAYPFTSSYFSSYVNTSTGAITNSNWVGAYRANVTSGILWTPLTPIPISSSIDVYGGAYNNTVTSYTITITYTDNSTSTLSSSSALNNWVGRLTATPTGKSLKSVAVTAGNWAQLNAVRVDGVFLVDGQYGSNDSLVDTPTSYGTDTGVGGEVRGNYATFNPITALNSGTVAFSNGNLELSQSGAWRPHVATMAISGGKFYWEITKTAGVTTDNAVGVAPASLAAVTTVYDSSFIYYRGDGVRVRTGTAQTSGASWGVNDIIGVALNMDAGEISFYKNGVLQVGAITGVSTTTSWLPYCGDDVSGTNTSWLANFGQRPFAYTAPSGFKALCDTNLPSPVVAKPSTVFDTKLYTGNGSTQNITGLGFSPDLVWIKSRSTGTLWHEVFDAIRGANNRLFTNTTNAETTNNTLSSFNSDGFTLSITDSNGYGVNLNNDSYVAWAWDAGSSTVTNTQGSITSTVRANASAGFSIVTVNSVTGSASATIGHGLNVTPAMYIQKARNTTYSWNTYFNNNGTWIYLTLNGTGAASATTTANMGTTPTSTTVGIGSNFVGSYDYVYYCFAPVAGYSSFGSYTGNGSTDGPFVFCGFRPKLVLARCSSGVADWWMYDSVRGAYNVNNAGLRPNSSNAETSDAQFDFLSNGFKIRTSGTDLNSNGGTHIFCAWAENPFQYARAR